MKVKDVKSYAQTFDPINRLQAEGQWSQGRAAVERLQVAADIKEVLRPKWQKLLIFLLRATFILAIVSLIVQAVVTGMILYRTAG